MEKIKKTNKNQTEILCIGTELLLGNILNSNAQWIAEQISALGLPHYRQTVIGDNKIRLINFFKEASKRSRILITTGGIGPTQDDITHESLAEGFGCKLVQSQEILKDIKLKFRKKNKNEYEMPKLNMKQSLIPIGSQIITNTLGTAPGIIWSPIREFTVLTFPGVPYEMKEMWRTIAEPWLKNNLDLGELFSSHIMRFSGLPESVIAERVADLIESKNPTIAPYADIGEVRLRITSRGKSKEHNEQLINPVIQDVNNRIGSYCYGQGEESLGSVTIGLLKNNKETLAIAESCTGGRLSSTLTEVPGASEVFLGGAVTYANQAKEKVLKVPQTLLEEFGAVSKETVIAMAKGIKTKLNSDWAIAISGVAGPGGGTKEKPVGTVYIAITGPKISQVIHESFGEHHSRKAIQILSVTRSLDMLRILLLSRS